MSNVANITFGDLTCSAYAALSGTALHKTLGELTLSSTGVAEISALLSSALGALTLTSTGAVQVSGTLVVTLGTLKGSQYDTSLTGAYAPYQQIATWDTHPSSGISVKTRLGNLKGIFGVDGEYGLYAGEGWDEDGGIAPLSTSKYLRASNIAIEGHNLPIRLYDAGSATIALDPAVPSFAMGSTLPTAFDTGIGLWMGKDTDDEYKLRIGDPSGTRLEWDGDSLNLYDALINMGGGSAGLAFGDPPPTSASSGTGVWIDKTGFYGLKDGTAQIFIDTLDGALYSSMENLKLDRDGLSFTDTQDGIFFYSGGTLSGALISDKDSSGNTNIIISNGLPTANLIRNGDFSSDNMAIWYLEDGSTSRYEEEYHSAPACMFIFMLTDNLGPFTTVAVSESTAYNFSYWLKASDVFNPDPYYWSGLFFSISELDEDKNFINSAVWEYAIWRTQDGHDWEEKSYNFTTGSETKYLRIEWDVSDSYAMRYAYIDDVSLRVTSGPTLHSSIELGTADINYRANEESGSGVHIFSGNVNIEDNLAVDGYATVADYLTASGGIHVGGTSDPGTDNLVVDGTIEDANGNLYGRPVFLTTPLTSTSWDGDSFSTTAKTKIDLSAVFGAPAGIKAILVALTIRDSGSGSNDCVFLLSTNDGDNYQGMALGASSPNDRYSRASIIMPCTADGDIYYRINASGTNTMDVFMSIWGYWL